MPKLKIVWVAAVLALTACGGPAETGGQVATLASTAPTKAVSPAAATAARPQLRLDTSEEEANRFWAAYNACLVKHGVKTNPGRAGAVAAVGGAPGLVLDDSGEPKAAYTACAGKLPQQPPELDEDKNPNYAQQWNDNVKCLRAHGLMVHVTNPGEWTYDSSDGTTPDNQAEIEHACLLEAFGGQAK